MSDTTPRYCVVDVETDGPDPQQHSMRSVAVVACDAHGSEIGAFQATLEPLPDATTSAATMAWWATQAEAWAEATRDPRPADEVVRELVAWLLVLPAPRVFVAHPLVFDGGWIDAYLRRFAGRILFDPESPDPLFAGSGLDLATFVSAVFDLPWRARPYAYPDELRGGHAHDHTALRDARGHAALFFGVRRVARDPGERRRLRELLLAADETA